MLRTGGRMFERTFIILLLQYLNVLSQELTLSNFHKHGLKKIRDHVRITEVKSLLDCASNTVAFNKPFFAYPNRTCFLLESLPNDRAGDDGHGEVLVYKDESFKDVCPEAPAVGNGTLVSVPGLHAGAEAMYRCNEGYSLCGGSNTSTCLDTGSWTTGVNCTEARTMWKKTNNPVIFLSCDFRYGSTLKGVLKISGFGKCTMALQDRQNNVLVGNVFAPFTKKLKFISEVNKKGSSSYRKVKSSFRSGKRFTYAFTYSSMGYEVSVDGRKMPMYKHRSNSKPYLFNFYGKCRIDSMQMLY